MSSLSVRHLLGIQELSAEDIQQILSTAAEFKEVLQRPIKKVPSLRDITIANLFFENSTRTKLSFELAEKRLSADVINFSGSQSSLAKGETLVDTANNILAMKVDMVVMRHSAPGSSHFLARRLAHVAKSKHAQIINAGDGTHEHPTQALLDAFTLQEHLGDLTGKRIAIVGDILHSRVALSNIRCLKKLGAEVSLCGPPTLIPKNVERLGIKVYHNLQEVVGSHDALNMLRIQKERQEGSYFPGNYEYARFYGLQQHHLQELDKPPLVLHPGPINRGVEISSEVVDQPDSLILDQVENGVAIRMAVLFLLANRL